jgi:hypothetical protein
MVLDGIEGFAPTKLMNSDMKYTNSKELEMSH